MLALKLVEIRYLKYLESITFLLLERKLVPEQPILIIVFINIITS
jgi:hypothetical protein